MIATLRARFMAEMIVTGVPRRDVPAFLTRHGFPQTAAHVRDVAQEARRIAAIAHLDADGAERAGWFHDVSVVLPLDERIAVAHACGVDVLPEEIAFPMIVHQKLSVVFARELFGERDAAVLSAIGCHTTLQADASPLDTVVFVADKIAWDLPGIPPYRNALLTALDASLDAAALVYLRYLWERRETLGVIHPWFRAAYRQRAAR